jgi:hypothetical protein
MFHSSRVKSLSAACVVCLSLAPRPAAAQGTAAAEVLFNEARKAMDAKDYDTACKRFRESNRLDPAVGTMLNLATCEDRRGRVATAWELFRGAYEKLPPSDPRHDYAKAQVDRLEPRLPHVTLTLAAGAPPDTKVRDGETIYSGAAFGLPLPVDPGKHDLVIEAPGRETRTVAVEIREAATMTIEIVPGAEKAESPAGTETGSAAQGDARETSSSAGGDGGGFGKKQWGFVAGGVGVVGIGVGITAGIMALGKKSTTDEQCSEALQRCSQEGHDAASAGRTLAAVSTVGWIVGAVGVGAGVYLILSSGGEKGPVTALQTTPLPGGAALTVKHRF